MWTNNKGGSHIPTAVKRHVLQRDNYTCQLGYPGRCQHSLSTRTAQYDHIVPLHQLGIARNDLRANEPGNLRAVCEPCHTHHTSLQGHQAKRAKRYRTPPTHPGLHRDTP